MNNMFYSNLSTKHLPNLFLPPCWLRRLSSTLMGLMLMILYLWLFSPPQPVLADFGEDFTFISSERKSTHSIALGDMDGDGDLDVAVGNWNDVNQVYRNEGGGTFSLAWQSDDDIKDTRTIAWGDYDGDGDLDLAVGNWNDINQVYRNEGEANFNLVWESSDEKGTYEVAWGDCDGDGLLDLAVANRSDVNQVYRNEGENSFNQDWWESNDNKISPSVAWGDYDGDGDLDLAVGNYNDVNQIYENDGTLTLAWQSDGDQMATYSVAWGDYDNDNDLDLLIGNAGYDSSQVYQNQGAGHFELVWSQPSDERQSTTSVAWADYDGDGDLDFALGNVLSSDNDEGFNQIYQNEGSGNFSLSWESSDEKDTFSAAWGDMDGDADLDLVAGNVSHANQVYWNKGGGSFRLAWQTPDTEIEYTRQVAWGDYNGDSNLDLGMANSTGDEVNLIYRGDGAGNFELDWQSPPTETKDSWTLAWGDYDGDGDLDLAVGNSWGDDNQIYRNEDGNFSLVWELEGDDLDSHSLAWGDYDGDGDLDLAIGNNSRRNQIYQNEGESGFNLLWESTDTLHTQSVAWGDYDGDGDLDLAYGNGGGFDEEINQIYQNDDAGNFNLVWQSPPNESKSTYSVAWGDMDGDGDLDLAVGNVLDVNQVYRNEGQANFSLAWQSPADELKTTRSVAWGDYDGDGDLDLAVGNSDTDNQLYQNDGTGNFNLAWQTMGDTQDTWSMVWGDMDNNKNLDLALGNGHTGINQVFESTLQGRGGLPNNAPFLAVTRPDSTGNANFFATAEILTNSTIPITYTLFDPEGEPLGRIEVLYSINGGDHWHEALPTTDTQTTNLATSQNGVSHLFTWDTFASGFFGQSDNVVLRFVAHPHVSSGIAGTYQYTNSAAGPYLQPSTSATTFPFRVRGSQVRVFSDTVPVTNAYVYRLPVGQSSGAELMANNVNQPFVSNYNGYLAGHGELNIGDKLIALLPITTTASYTLYHTSAAPTLSGLDMDSVTAPGVQELVVSPDNSLLLFDLDVSLEWDARNDSAFLEQLKFDLKRTSQFLYDWTNGQVALGKVRVFHAKENWLDSHVIIPASNNRRPNADLGGIVTFPLSETLVTGEVITNAYLPGQVRMAPIWNRFGNIDDELGLDWPRTLAHELGHYLFFLPDNYLGSENGRLIQVECQGSAMTDPYRDDYSEFLTRPEWGGDCEQTLAHQSLGRVDWETMTAFYPMLNGSYENRNQGPASLPLAVTQVTFLGPETPPNTLIDPFFYVTDEEGTRLELPIGQAQAYLFKTRGTANLTDDVVIPIGVPFAEQVEARGAEPGDRLCLFDYSQTTRRLGCLEPITQGSTNLPLHEVPDWQPQITVSPVTSRTLTITVTQAITSGSLYAQILPAAHPTTTGVITAPVAAMIPILADTFTQTITLDYPIANAFVRVWLTGTEPLREEMSEFFLSSGWGPGSVGGAWGPGSVGGAWGPGSVGGAWGPGSHRYGWGVIRRHGWDAPVTSADGQVTILDLDHIYGESPMYGLQSLSSPPDLPPWLTPVGQAYRFSAADALTNTLTIMFNYLQREVPNNRENRLWMAYSPNEGETWQLLSPELDTYHNLASTEMPGEGIYTLISTIDIPLTGPYWNVFSYLAATQPVTEALASIDGYYTYVANYDPSRAEPWIFYDPAVERDFAPLVNDLTELELEESYFIHVTDTITLYLPGDGIESRLMESSSLQLPPATFYGWITPTASFTPTVGMSVTASIDGNVCGETTIVELDGQLAYKLQVMAENITGPPNGCGGSGQNVVFEVGDRLMPSNYAWDNSHAWFHSLSAAEEQATVGSSVALQGRPSPPDSTWSVPLSVTLTILGESEPAYSLSVMTDENGTFILTGIEPDTYQIAIKKSTTLTNIQLETLVAGDNNIHFGTLREGDANNDNFVSILDFSILAAAFSTCSDDPDFDPRADFNGDRCITIRDFSLLASNFGQGGDNFEAQPAQTILPSHSPSADGASIVIYPASTTIATGELLTVTVQIEADNQQIDAAQASLNFDPQLLEVHKITAGSALRLSLQNQFDNTNGIIEFAAGSLNDFPSDTFDLVKIQFRALGASEGTKLAIKSDSNVTFGGTSVLGTQSDGIVIIRQPTAIMLHSLTSPTMTSLLWALIPLALTGLAGVIVMWRRRYQTIKY